VRLKQDFYQRPIPRPRQPTWESPTPESSRATPAGQSAPSISFGLAKPPDNRRTIVYPVLPSMAMVHVPSRRKSLDVFRKCETAPLRSITYGAHLHRTVGMIFLRCCNTRNRRILFETSSSSPRLLPASSERETAEPLSSLLLGLSSALYLPCSPDQSNSTEI